MKELVFALEFKGSAGPVPGSDNRLRAKTSAPGQTLRSLLKPDGVQAAIEPAGGDSASFESEVEIVGEGSLSGESRSKRWGGASSARVPRLAFSGARSSGRSRAGRGGLPTHKG